jgi:hypothetical protein
MSKKSPKTKDDLDFTEDDTKIKIAQFGGHLLLCNGSRFKTIDARELSFIKDTFGIEKFTKLKSLSQSELQDLWSACSK